jgi:hypothetical protein
MRWTKTETAVKKDVKEPARQEEKAQTVSDQKVKDKELIPAE